VLYLDGMKYGDRQMTAQGILATICFLCISRGAPLPQLSPVHPPTSIFHPALFISMIGTYTLAEARLHPSCFSSGLVVSCASLLLLVNGK
jgi:cation-transporting ATPase 13A1